MKLTDTQRRLLAAASQRDDRALERPSNLTGGAAGKVVAKLVTEGLIEEIQSRGSLPVWRRDGDNTHAPTTRRPRLTNGRKSRPPGRRSRASQFSHPAITVRQPGLPSGAPVPSRRT
jgi:hypothetical protein